MRGPTFGERSRTHWSGTHLAVTDGMRSMLLFTAVIGLAACSRDARPAHVGAHLGDTHVSEAPSDPTVPPPDAATAAEPTPGYEITGPIGSQPVQPPATPTAPSSNPPEQQPGVFAPPPQAPNGTPVVAPPSGPTAPAPTQGSPSTPDLTRQ